MMSRWPRRGRSLLDVGCGTGILSEFLWQGGFDLSCLDQSQAMLDYAQARLGKRADAYLGLAEQLPFDDRSFDYVTLLGVLEELDDPFPAIQEAFRVAARGVAFGFLNACSLARLEQSLGLKDRPSLACKPRWLGLPTLCGILRLAWAEGKPRFGTVVLGPSRTWQNSRLCALINSLRLPLPLGACALLCVTREQGLPLTGLPLRLGKVGMGKAESPAAMPSLQIRHKEQAAPYWNEAGPKAKSKTRNYRKKKL